MLHLTPSRNLHLASAILLSNSILISTGRVCYSLLCVFHITYVLVAHFSLFVIIFWVLYSLENEFLGGRNYVLLVSRMSLPQHLTDTRRCISRCLKPHIIGPSLSFQPQIDPFIRCRCSAQRTQHPGPAASLSCPHNAVVMAPSSTAPQPPHIL